MPPLPLVPGVCKVTLGGTYHDTSWFNILHVGYSGAAPSSANCLSYLDVVQAAAAVAWNAEMSVDNHLTSCEVLDLSSDTPGFAESSFDEAGSRTGDFTPANSAVLASHEVLRRYRGGHPRTYLSWGTAGTYATGSTKDWDPDFLTDCGLKWNAFIAAITGVTEGGTTWNDLVSVSYYSGGARRPSAVVDIVQSTTMRPRICTQRRRLGRIGG